MQWYSIRSTSCELSHGFYVYCWKLQMMTHISPLVPPYLSLPILFSLLKSGCWWMSYTVIFDMQVMSCICQFTPGWIFLEKGWDLLNENINTHYLFAKIPKNKLSCMSVRDIITHQEANINSIGESHWYHHHHHFRSQFPVWRFRGYPPWEHPKFPLCGYLPTYMSHKSSCRYISRNKFCSDSILINCLPVRQ